MVCGLPFALIVRTIGLTVVRSVYFQQGIVETFPGTHIYLVMDAFKLYVCHWARTLYVTCRLRDGQ
jgi:hypothetical protein